MNPWIGLLDLLGWIVVVIVGILALFSIFKLVQLCIADLFKKPVSARQDKATLMQAEADWENERDAARADAAQIFQHALHSKEVNAAFILGVEWAHSYSRKSA